MYKKLSVFLGAFSVWVIAKILLFSFGIISALNWLLEALTTMPVDNEKGTKLGTFMYVLVDWGS